MSGGVERLAAVGARVGESPLWLPERGVWLWLDLQGRRVHRFDPATGTDAVIAEGFAEDLACLARWTAEAVLLVSVRGFHRLTLADGRVSPLPCPIDLPEGTIFNDGKVDRQGALWIGSSDAGEAAPIGRLWRIAGGRVTEVAAGFTVSNGPAFSPDGRTAYFADTFGRRLLRFALDGSGRVEAQAVFAEVAAEAGYPDGMTVDRDGTLSVGHWDGARISRWTPDGRALPDLAMPARNVTALAFGGAGMRQAVVTTAILFPGQAAEETLPWNGDLLGFASDVPGLEEPALSPDWAG
ncbi:gluconolaconase [Tabrizicola sp. TH137]|uniref:SMP-30/gluconolactonase/LRE family protein n=1 Tax=Tabrizicola sp. TH137 TaxID=2067452 RepID=UPI000C7AE558|nr:SMP-30/gluconolactonase/LRE family protein [Tabrizicola sp. TH137]PLL12490.1 gluconolaconase [Tabrizicola sp. TH137]